MVLYEAKLQGFTNYTKDEKSIHVAGVKAKADFNKANISMGICPKCGGKLLNEKENTETFWVVLIIRDVILPTICKEVIMSKLLLIHGSCADQNADAVVNAANSIRISDMFTKWEKECSERFSTLKANEEELNRIFIEIYGLQDELTPEVQDKDVTVRLADQSRDIKSFISYAVGCMFGRYSLRSQGLAYAGGQMDMKKYQYFIPDADNVIPITDDAYFNDDIVTRFVEFARQVYGESTLEENLKFIAESLGNKGDTPKEVIRSYFLNDFYKDHCKNYQKRPIYWLFDSGKENGFKALIYMHRYDNQTPARVRTDYLHKLQKMYEATLVQCPQIDENPATTARDKAANIKRMAKITKQLEETRLYDQALGHLSSQYIDIDLDDGVNVNYEKFQGVQVAREGQKAIKIDLLGKRG